MLPDFALIGRRIKELRAMQGISQADLAELTDMSVPYISHIERAVKHVSLTALMQISHALGITVDSLLNGNQPHDPAEYHSDISYLLEDCNGYEKRIIYEIASATKKSLRDNSYLQYKFRI